MQRTKSGIVNGKKKIRVCLTCFSNPFLVASLLESAKRVLAGNWTYISTRVTSPHKIAE